MSHRYHSTLHLKQRVYRSNARGHITKPKYSFGPTRIHCTSRYMPHQGKREIQRRLKKG